MSSNFRPRLTRFRTRTVLVAVMAAIIAATTITSLLIVRWEQQRQIVAAFSDSLTRSAESFNQMQADHLAAERRTCALLADLPSLKALMTTQDQRTIQDGAVDFWRTSDSDLFALARQDGEVVAAYTRGRPAGPRLAAALHQLLLVPGRYEIVDSDRLFEVAVQPLYFGNAASGTLLGFVYTGFAIDARFVPQLSRSSNVGVTFASGDRVLASSLPAPVRRQLVSSLAAAPIVTGRQRQIALGGERYLAIALDLSNMADAPLLLVLTQSFLGADQALHRINLLILLAAFVAGLAGAALMSLLARAVTEPLELLAEDVVAFGRGDVLRNLPVQGTVEMRALDAAFRQMRDRIALANAALLESERLATIGRMASSVSHDLRHYLASVYANAEFMAEPGLSALEREELYSDIKSAVLGTTELIDSLLAFSRTGNPRDCAAQALVPIVHRARAIVEPHPDAAGVSIVVDVQTTANLVVLMEPKQMERAIFNLLLNACQAERLPAVPRTVMVTISRHRGQVAVTVIDNGIGVPEGVRSSLFDPFVSEGKQRGMGLGLTLVQSVAQDHGGTISLERSEIGYTAFRLVLPEFVDPSPPPSLPSVPADVPSEEAIS